MHNAILIEDEHPDAERVGEVLRNSGFEIVERFEDATSAAIGCSGRSDLIDLVVIDRRLPQEQRQEPLDSVGDELLEIVLEHMSDSLVVVFTAHGDTDNAEKATAERGVIAVDEDHTFDRVRHFQKTNYRGFETYVQKVGSALDELNAIDVEGIDGAGCTPTATRRLLRKLAVLDRGRAVSAWPLDGGRTRRAVYNTRVVDLDGALRSRNVVKVGPVRRRTESGGYSTLLDAGFVAAPVNKLVGLCAGLQAQILQLAGQDPVTLFSLLESRESEAVAILGTLRSATKELPSVERAVPVEQLFVFSDRSKVRLLCNSLGLPPVRDNLMALARVGAQHGDLHAGNVLVVDDAPVLIDFDNTMHASLSVDPLTMLLSSMFHASSPFREKTWFTDKTAIDFFNPGFLAGCPAPDWFGAVVDWLSDSRTSTREIAALTLSYVVRQLAFPDFPSTGPLHDAAIALARDAAQKLSLV